MPAVVPVHVRRGVPRHGRGVVGDGPVHAFGFFGGSTPILVPDNCKTGVLKNTVDELVVNEQYRRMAEHYGVCVNHKANKMARSI